MATLTVSAPAKINLVLDLLAKRGDGYHEVEFLMQELALHDTLSFSRRDDGVIRLSCDDPAVFCDERNLIVRAAKLLQQEFRVAYGAEIHVTKRLPLAGGLGSSSSHATNTLKALSSLWQLGLAKEQVLDLAIRIGMDCAFFVLGGTCIARGRGEEVEQTISPPKLPILILLPTVNVPANKTAWIYGNFSLSRVSRHPAVSEAVSAIESGDREMLCAALGNVFEQGLVIAEYAPVWQLLAELRSSTGVETALLAGAGPTVFAVTESEAVAEKLAEKYRRQGLGAIVTQTVVLS